MQDIPGGSGPGPDLHAREGAGELRFAGLVLDLDACTLARESGETIALTRGELSLLRAFVSRPGRTLSRDVLLGASANRTLEPYDRSVDVLVGRLRRKIEADPKAPRLIVTVPGEGYRFDGRPVRTSRHDATASSIRNDAREASIAAETLAGRRPLAAVLAGLALAMLALAILALWPIGAVRNGSTTEPPRVAVLPFANLSGDGAMDYLGPSLALELTTLLATYPGVSVIAPPLSSATGSTDAMRLAREAHLRYVLRGGVHKLPDRLRVTAQLYDGETGAAIWADQIDSSGVDPLWLQEQIANRIYDSVAGLHGSIRLDEQQAAWAKSPMALGEYDYYLRGLTFHMFGTPQDSLRARAIWREGLGKFPDSTLLRIKLGFTYLYPVMNQTSADPRADIEQAWRYVEEADVRGPLSPFEAWHAHWLKAFLYQWRDNDFSRSVAEARAAVALVPNDPLSRGDLAWVLANAGYGEEAIAWARMGLDHHPNPPQWFRANLSWAYYVSGRYREGLEALRGMPDDTIALRIANQVRLGAVDEARATVADYLKRGGRDTVAQEALFPQIEPDRTEYLKALRTAGLPES